MLLAGWFRSIVRLEQVYCRLSRGRLGGAVIGGGIGDPDSHLGEHRPVSRSPLAGPLAGRLRRLRISKMRFAEIQPGGHSSPSTRDSETRAVAGSAAKSLQCCRASKRCREIFNFSVSNCHSQSQIRLHPKNTRISIARGTFKGLRLQRMDCAAASLLAAGISAGLVL